MKNKKNKVKYKQSNCTQKIHKIAIKIFKIMQKSKKNSQIKNL